MTRIDHAARSERTAAFLGESYIADMGLTDATATLTMLDALRDAVLALAEQQRIATVVELANLRQDRPEYQIQQDARDAVLIYHPHDNPELGGWHELRPDIAAALGIGGGQ